MPREDLDLRVLREARGLSYKEIYSQIRISPAVLKAIEEGRFDALPEPVYARRLIKIYADFLNGDSRSILERYDLYLGSIRKTALEERKDRREKGIGVTWQWWPQGMETSEKKDDDGKAAEQKGRKMPPPLALVSIIVLTAGIYLSAAYHYGLLPFSTTPGQVSMRSEAKNPAESMAPTPAATPIPVVPPQGKTPPEEKPLTLVIDVHEQTWLRIRQDEKAPVTTLASPGERLELHARASFQLDIGNAGGVDLTFQGKPLGKLGKRGQVVHIGLP